MAFAPINIAGFAQVSGGGAGFQQLGASVMAMAMRAKEARENRLFATNQIYARENERFRTAQRIAELEMGVEAERQEIDRRAKIAAQDAQDDAAYGMSVLARQAAGRAQTTPLRIDPRSRAAIVGELRESQGFREDSGPQVIGQMADALEKNINYKVLDEQDYDAAMAILAEESKGSMAGFADLKTAFDEHLANLGITRGGDFANDVWLREERKALADPIYERYMQTRERNPAQLYDSNSRDYDAEVTVDPTRDFHINLKKFLEEGTGGTAQDWLASKGIEGSLPNSPLTVRFEGVDMNPRIISDPRQDRLGVSKKVLDEIMLDPAGLDHQFRGRAILGTRHTKTTIDRTRFRADLTSQIPAESAPPEIYDIDPEDLLFGGAVIPRASGERHPLTMDAFDGAFAPTTAAPGVLDMGALLPEFED